MSTTTKNLMIGTQTQIKKRRKTRWMKSKKSKKTSQRSQEKPVGVISQRRIKGCDRNYARVVWNHSLQALPSTTPRKAASLTQTKLPTLTRSKSPLNSSQTTQATFLKKYRCHRPACTRYTPHQLLLLSRIA